MILRISKNYDFENIKIYDFEEPTHRSPVRWHHRHTTVRPHTFSTHVEKGKKKSSISEFELKKESCIREFKVKKRDMNKWVWIETTIVSPVACMSKKKKKRVMYISEFELNVTGKSHVTPVKKIWNDNSVTCDTQLEKKEKKIHVQVSLYRMSQERVMGWLRVVGSLKFKVSFTKSPIKETIFCKRDL